MLRASTLLLRIGFWASIALYPFGAAMSVELVGDYRLQQGSFANFVTGPGALASLTATVHGGTAGFVPAGWAWNDAASPGTGLNLLDIPQSLSTSYSIGVTVTYSETSSYRKLADFVNPSATYSDSGVYVFNQGLLFYPSTQAAGTVASDQAFTFILTRASSKRVDLYLNGDSVPVSSFNDNFDLAVISQGLVKFFQDDATTGIEYSKSGVASLIRVWNGALTPSQIAGAMTVPEPSAWLLGLTACFAIALRLRLRAA